MGIARLRRLDDSFSRTRNHFHILVLRIESVALLCVAISKKNIPGVTKVNEAPCMMGSRQPIRLCKNVARPAAKNIELTIFDLIT